jgi:hypothetical protein
MPNEIERRLEIALRRGARFFSDGGLCDRYERRDDYLVQFHEIVNWLTYTVPGLSRDAVIGIFRFSMKNHGFGRHGPRQTIEQLIDLNNRDAPAGLYPLRPSGLRAEACPEFMRARRSVWAQWIQAQGWPVPPELARSILIEGEALELSTGQTAQPSASAGSALPPSAPCPPDANATVLRAAIRAALKSGVRPGKTIGWGPFQGNLTRHCGASEGQRGFGVRQIQRIVEDELKQL